MHRRLSPGRLNGHSTVTLDGNLNGERNGDLVTIETVTFMVNLSVTPTFITTAILAVR